MKLDLDKVSIDLREYASQGNAILGIRDSGKTYTATMIAERLMDTGIPIIAIDPIGIWRNLRIPAPGVKGAKGYPVVVAGGLHGDLPLTPQSAPELVRAAMRAGVSIVLDLYSMDLSKADWKRIVTAVLKVLLYENKEFGLRHVFIEEAAEFCPQIMPKDGMTGHVYAEVEKLARMGGNALLGYTLINQRAEQVNKAVLELCDGMLLHRQKGKNSLNSLEKWLDLGTGAGGKEIRASLPMLTAGECWYWPPMSDQAYRVKMPPKRTLHPDRRAMRDGKGAQAAAAAVDVSSFVAEMKEALPKIAAEADANDPAKLKAEIAKLKKELSAKPTPAPTIDPKHIEEAERRGYQQGKRVGYVDGYNACRQDVIDNLPAVVLECPDEYQICVDPIINPEAKTPSAARGAAAKPAPVTKRQPREETSKLPPGERAVLIAAVQYGGVERDQLSVLTGYKRSSRDAYIARLREKGLVEVSGATISPTPSAVDTLGVDYQPLPTGRALQEYWMERLPEGERRVLSCLIEHYPDSVARSVIDDATGYKRSSRDAYIARLKARRLINVTSDGVAAVTTLF